MKVFVGHPPFDGWKGIAIESIRKFHVPLPLV